MIDEAEKLNRHGNGGDGHPGAAGARVAEDERDRLAGGQALGKNDLRRTAAEARVPQRDTERALARPDGQPVFHGTVRRQWIGKGVAQVRSVHRPAVEETPLLDRDAAPRRNLTAGPHRDGEGDVGGSSGQESIDSGGLGRARYDGRPLERDLCPGHPGAAAGEAGPGKQQDGRQKGEDGRRKGEMKCPGSL